MHCAISAGTRGEVETVSSLSSDCIGSYTEPLAPNDDGCGWVAPLMGAIAGLDLHPVGLYDMETTITLWRTLGGMNGAALTGH